MKEDETVKDTRIRIWLGLGFELVIPDELNRNCIKKITVEYEHEIYGTTRKNAIIYEKEREATNG